MKIYLVDDHEILSEGVKTLLEQADDLQVVGYSTSAEEALVFLAKNPVDLVITDMSLPQMDGLTFFRKARPLQPGARFLMLSMHDESYLVREVLGAGIDGYVLKKDSHLELLEAIAAVQNGQRYISREINKVLLADLHGNNAEKLLTTREREVLSLIVKELSNKEIAVHLHISERTVETHRKNLFRKTRSNSVVGLINFAYANKLV